MLPFDWYGNLGDYWNQRTNLRVVGDPYHVYRDSKHPRPYLILPRSGDEMGHVLQQLETTEIELLVHHRSLSAGTSSYDDYVVLSLRSDEKVFGRGIIWLIRDHSDGDLQRELYELEGGDSDEGRGDHVGGYGAEISNGP